MLGRVLLLLVVVAGLCIGCSPRQAPLSEPKRAADVPNATLPPRAIATH